MKKRSIIYKNKYFSINNEFKLKEITKLLLIIYLMAGLGFFLLQKSIIYKPYSQSFNDCTDLSEFKKMNFNETRFYFKNLSDKNVIILYHGNAGSACDRSYYKYIFEESNYSLIFVEYAGYSNDLKKPSINLILNDVKNINEFIKTQSFENIVVYGESVGSGAASYQTYLSNVNALILVGSFSNFEEVVKSKLIIYPISLLLTEKYNNALWLKDFNGKLMILHGEKDYVINPKFSKELYSKIPSKQKEYILIKNAGHNDLLNYGEFESSIKKFIKEQKQQV